MLNRQLVYLYRMHRSGDSWGDCMAFWFAICEELTWRDAPVPAAWQYRPGALGVSSPEDASQEDAGLRADFADIPAAALREFGDALARLSAMLHARGKSY